MTKPKKIIHSTGVQHMVQSAGALRKFPNSIHKKIFYQAAFLTPYLGKEWVLGMRAGELLAFLIDSIKESVENEV